jgi:aminomethyltransferase
MTIKTTPLTAKHIELGAKMAPFAGYNMPISYTSLSEEHLCVRQNVGVFDVSHMGEFIVRGKEALDLVQMVTSNDASKLQIGDVQYACLPNAEGGIVDDLLVYRLPESYCSEGEMAFMLVVNASNIEKDWDWISSFNKYEARMINISDQTALLALQGPNATAVLTQLTDVDVAALRYYSFAKGTVAGIENVLISATGYTGAGGYELYVVNEHAEALWDALFDAGKSIGIQPIGLGARDTLRLEKGYCLYGNDINDSTSPIAAGLGWITKTKKASGFISADTFRQQVAEGVPMRLVGFKLDERRVPRHDYRINDEAGNDIGVVTSGTQSPSLGYPIGMGYVPTAYSTAGSTIYIVFGGKQLAATVVKLPFL